MSSPLGLVGEWNGGSTGAAACRSGAPKSGLPDASRHQDKAGAGDCRVQETAGCRSQWQVNHRLCLCSLHTLLHKLEYSCKHAD